MQTLRDQACIVGVGETAYTRGSQKSALRLVLEASRHAMADAGMTTHDIDGFVLPGPYLFQEQLAANLGVRMVSRVLDLDPEQLRVGLPVTVVFDDVTPEVTLPKFRPLPQSVAV